MTTLAIEQADCPEDFAPAALAPESCATSSCSSPRFMAIMITRRCNMTCSHCSVASGPGIKNEPTEDEVLDRVRQMIDAGVRSLQITGGEPMIRRELVERVLTYANSRGVPSSMSSNGFWGKDLREARATVRDLMKLGLLLVTISYDRFHAPFQDETSIRNIVEACATEGLNMNLNITRLKDEQELGDLADVAGRHSNIRVRFYDVQPVGRAKHFDPDSFRAEVEGFCNAASNPVMTDDGRIMACNGPSYFTKPGSPLHIGKVGEESVSSMLARHRDDPILETVRVFGPSKLRQEFEAVRNGSAFQFRERYHGLCDLCAHVNTSPEVVSVLHERLSRPEFKAQLQGMRMVCAAQTGRMRTVNHVNRYEARHFFFRQACEPERDLDHADQRLIGRADFNWKEIGDYFAACGLATPLGPTLEHPAMQRYAPAFFLERMKRSATAGHIKLMVAKQALAIVSGTLGRLGTTGTLLKGSVVVLHPASGQYVKAPGDIDLLVDPRRISEIYEALIAEGFEAPANYQSKLARDHHHLDPLVFRGVALELHGSIAQPHLGIPDGEFLKNPVPLGGALYSMRPEAMFYHVAAHSMWHQCSTGLKSAWLADWILRNHPDFNWNDVLELVRITPSSRSFWAPLLPWKRVLGMAIPDWVLEKMPDDRMQKRLNRIAQRHALTSIGKAGEKEPFLVAATILLSCSDSRWIVPTVNKAAKRFFGEARHRTIWSLQEIRSSESLGAWAKKRAESFQRSYEAFIAG